MWEAIKNSLKDISPEKRVLVVVLLCGISTLWISLKESHSDERRQTIEDRATIIQLHRTIDSLLNDKYQQEKENNLRLKILIETQKHQKELLKQFQDESN